MVPVVLLSPLRGDTYCVERVVPPGEVRVKVCLRCPPGVSSTESCSGALHVSRRSVAFLPRGFARGFARGFNIHPFGSIQLTVGSIQVTVGMSPMLATAGAWRQSGGRVSAGVRVFQIEIIG